MECREWPGTLLCCGAERGGNNGDADWQTMEKRNKSVEERTGSRAEDGGRTPEARQCTAKRGERGAARNWQFAL